MLRRWCKEGGRNRILLLLGGSALAMLLLSGLLPKQKNSVQAEPPPQNSAVSQATAYAAETERRLTELLEQMDGVGAVTVMVTVEGTAEEKYAEEVRESESDSSRQTERACVLARIDGDDTPLVAKTQYPALSGVAVLCTGGGSPKVQEKVVRAVSTVLDIPSSDIYVGQQVTVPTT